MLKTVDSRFSINYIVNPGQIRWIFLQGMSNRRTVAMSKQIYIQLTMYTLGDFFKQRKDTNKNSLGLENLYVIPWLFMTAESKCLCVLITM